MTELPPHAPEAEAAVLSAVLLDPTLIDEIRDNVVDGDFWLPLHAAVWRELIELTELGGTPDVVSVAERLRADGRLEAVGGTPALAELVDSTPAVAHVLDHARLVGSIGRQRRMASTLARWAAEGRARHDDPDAWIQRVEAAVYRAAEDHRRTDQPEWIRTIVQSEVTTLVARARGESVRSDASSSGYTELDRMLSGGLRPGELVVLAARPGMGKTALAMGIATRVARGGAVALVMSLEMPKDQLGVRVLAQEAQVPLTAVRCGQLSREDLARLTSTAAEVATLPLVVRDTPAATLADVRGTIRRVMRGRTEPLGLVVIDYLQLMNGQRARGDSRENEVAALSRGCKAIAKEFGVPVLALSQLNRGVETRGAKDRRPTLSDLRDSGAIEQDADAVLFIYRDEYYSKDSPDKGTAEVIVAKQRNGPTGRVVLKFAAAFTRFDDLSEQYADLGFDADDYDQEARYP